MRAILPTASLLAAAAAVPIDLPINHLIVRLVHRLDSTPYTKGGRFDQDPAAEMPLLPLLARAKELPSLPRDSDEFGFLETELMRGRNAVEETLREAASELEAYLSTRGRGL